MIKAGGTHGRYGSGGLYIRSVSTWTGPCWFGQVEYFQKDLVINMVQHTDGDAFTMAILVTCLS